MRNPIAKFIILFTVIVLFFGTKHASAQEIKSTVQVVAPRVTMTDKQILNTLQTAAQQFINTRKWTDENIALQEKIDVSLFIEITAINNNEFQGTLQFQVVRPVFNSTYKTTVFQFNDKMFRLSIENLRTSITRKT